MADISLSVENLYKSFHVGEARIEAVKNVSLYVEDGEVVGLVGESGCGKSSLAKLIARFENPDGGRISLCGKDITELKGAPLRRAYQEIKMIFQEPRLSFDPRLSLGASIRETLKTREKMTAKQYRAASKKLLCQVGLDDSYDEALPMDVSGGECQRAAIARAIAGRPKLLICDEATSALDVSVQAQILELLNKVREKNSMSLLFISHDLALVSSFCNRIYVMHEGHIVEEGKTSQVIENPRNEYTKSLLASVLQI